MVPLLGTLQEQVAGELLRHAGCAGPREARLSGARLPGGQEKADARAIADGGGDGEQLPCRVRCRHPVGIALGSAERGRRDLALGPAIRGAGRPDLRAQVLRWYRRSVVMTD